MMVIEFKFQLTYFIDDDSEEGEVVPRTQKWMIMLQSTMLPDFYFNNRNVLII